MKIKNIFKKTAKTVVKANVQKLEKNQLEKVVGGVDSTIIDTTVVDPAIDYSRSGQHKVITIK
jgi:hypothetical protein